MSLHDKIDGQGLMTWAITGAAGAFVFASKWVVTHILTNKRQIALLQQEIRHREEARAEEKREVREALSQIHTDIKDLRTETLSLFARDR